MEIESGKALDGIVTSSSKCHLLLVSQCRRYAEAFNVQILSLHLSENERKIMGTCDYILLS